MTGAELRRIMKMRRIKTAEAANALDIHPQTIRNLWAKDEVPRLYLLALTSYVWALGQEGPLNPNPEGVRMKRAVPFHSLGGTAKVEMAKPTAPPMRTGESAGGDLWSKLK